MQQEQIKTLLVNGATGLVVVGVLVAGYLVFVKKEPELVVSSVTISPEEVAVQTGSIGADIERAVRDLEDLNRAVQDSATVFGMATFKRLKDLSVRVSAEAVGRENPFVPAEWKVKMKVFEEATGKQVVQKVSSQTVSKKQAETQSQPALAQPQPIPDTPQAPSDTPQTLPAVPQTPPLIPGDSLGDFPLDIL